MAELAVFDKDPNIYLFTSLTAGSSHIITATSRIETILRANKIPFIGLDTATHELGKKLFQRRAAGKKLPLLVKEGYVLGGIEEIEEWNEYDELHEALGVDTAFTAYPPKPTSLFEPVPSKTPPPLADALPGGFSFGSSAGPAFGSLGGIGGRAKENTPIASAEQNLAIRQMGAEAAKLAASKKPTPVKISTTNPLLTEKTNANSPANILSPKSTPLPMSPNADTTEKNKVEPKKAEAPEILSPRSIPLPETPTTAPKLEQQKPIHAPPSMHVDAGNPALSAGPIKTTQAKEESPEESSDDEEESSEDSSEEESGEDSTTAKAAEKTQDQDPKDASKVGESVKEGEQEEVSGDQKSEVSAKADTEAKKVEAKATETKEAKATESAEPKATTEGKETKVAETKAVESTETKPTTTKDDVPASEPKQSSSEETSEEEEDSEDEEDDEEDDEKKVEPKKDDVLKKEEPKKDDVQKTQAQDAKDATKAGESVLD
ncbi:hypothetical protein C7974DRAFT_423003 [Boeremia exigua]|uniref:uncharacterized protein n=1 Tax=Boeremia exigua TaxID=749465 RepID=UPI001E8ED0C7|nr:uncharacterized protein C7974DRAFT_423003 [Boeremia exigua]KAH6638074.1 hypothetical protein C7974DRAFT_423003 [Boeremia exigua]